MPTDAEVDAAEAYLPECIIHWRDDITKDMLAAAEVVRTQATLGADRAQTDRSIAECDRVTQALTGGQTHPRTTPPSQPSEEWPPRWGSYHRTTIRPQSSDTQPPRQDYHNSAVPGDGIETAGPLTR